MNAANEPFMFITCKRVGSDLLCTPWSYGDSTSSASRNALLAQGGAILAQQLGQRIGIEDVGIEQNLANETSLVFGKYLSSRLYVSYGISLAETLNTLKLRYSINDRWTVRTEAGKEVSADVVYTVEKP